MLVYKMMKQFHHLQFLLDYFSHHENNYKQLILAFHIAKNLLPFPQNHNYKIYLHHVNIDNVVNWVHYVHYIAESSYSQSDENN